MCHPVCLSLMEFGRISVHLVTTVEHSNPFNPTQRSLSTWIESPCTCSNFFFKFVPSCGGCCCWPPSSQTVVRSLDLNDIFLCGLDDDQGDCSLGWDCWVIAKWIAHSTLCSSPSGHSCFAGLPAHLNQDLNGDETTPRTVESVIHFAMTQQSQPRLQSPWTEWNWDLTPY